MQGTHSVSVRSVKMHLCFLISAERINSMYAFIEICQTFPHGFYQTCQHGNRTFFFWSFKIHAKPPLNTQVTMSHNASIRCWIVYLANLQRSGPLKADEQLFHYATCFYKSQVRHSEMSSRQEAFYIKTLRRLWVVMWLGIPHLRPGL